MSMPDRPHAPIGPQLTMLSFHNSLPPIFALRPTRQWWCWLVLGHDEADPCHGYRGVAVIEPDTCGPLTCREPRGIGARILHLPGARKGGHEDGNCF